MILTLAWKEFREHRSIWLTMVVMTCVLALGLNELVGVGDPANAMVAVTLAILCMAGAYGVVCGSMMYAGEHEGGTLVFLDIFHGRRGLLWLGKAAVGVLLVLTEALAVAGLLYLLKQAPPAWAPVLIGQPHGGGLDRHAGLRSGMQFWFLVLPVVTLEAYVWGLFGSALTRRVLTGAAVAALAATPIWLIFVNAPAPVFLGIRIVAAALVLIVSATVFVMQSRETAAGPPPMPEEQSDEPRRRLDALWEELQRDDALADPGWGDAAADIPVVYPTGRSAHPPLAPTRRGQQPAARRQPSSPTGRAVQVDDAPGSGRNGARTRRRTAATAAESPTDALIWLTLQQAWGFFGMLAAACLFIGLFMPSYGQLLWPIATLLLGVACGTAAFAPEQRDLSYQFLAALHMPLRSIWRFKIMFWFAAALLATLLIGFAALVVACLRVTGGRGNEPMVAFQFGTLRDVMGPVLFFSIWLVYGFATGQLIVWLCRKSVLAVLLSGLISAAALGLWLPSLLCRGMSGWPLWLPPLAMLAAGHVLVRAWAGGRIKERRPALALAAFGAAALLWLGANLGHRAWAIPDVGAPIDRIAFRAARIADANPAGPKIQEALADIENPAGKSQWLVRMAEAARLPVGTLEPPRMDGQPPLLAHLPGSRKITERLRAMARAKQTAGGPGAALDHLAQILALSRNLRNQTLAGSYVPGVQTEESALDGLDAWLAHAEPAPALLRRVLDELDRHQADTPPAVDCVRAESFRAGGLLANPSVWTLAAPGPGRVPEGWMARGVAVSLELPWESERKTRLWQVVWAGLFRAIETPHWQLPESADPPVPGADPTQEILRGWLPAEAGPGAAEVAGLLRESWLNDDRLFVAVVPLRAAATRALWRVDATRLAVALALYELEAGAPAQKLGDLVPKYLAKLPVDPYSGESFRYRISPGENIELLGDVRAGQGVLWSTGPDRRDNGGQLHGGRLQDADAEWAGGGFDLVTRVPFWP